MPNTLMDTRVAKVRRQRAYHFNSKSARSNICRPSQESAVSDILPSATDAAIDLSRAVIW